ncbi:hypothetical protein BJ165DRAFT_1501799 [Panaeolus papilionaceus]|nr:hypothetical protein BJ165DRAFT_1501799 [Panaeolus papilionaceus]
MLSLVCRYWREAATSAPELWTRIFLSPSMKCPELALDCWLARSGSLPLSISIRADQTSQLPSDSPFFHCIELLRSISSRWKKVTLNINQEMWPNFSHIFHDTWVQSPLILESVDIGIVWIVRAQAVNQNLDVKQFISRFLPPSIISVKIRTAPGPTHKRMADGQDIMFTPVLLPNLFQCRLITSIVLANQRIDDLETLFGNLKQLNGLKSLEIRDCKATTSLYDRCPPTLLPALKSFYLDSWCLSLPIFSLSLPSLEELVVRPLDDARTNDFYYMLVRSKCPLRYLHFQSSSLCFRSRMKHIFLSRAFLGLNELTIESCTVPNRNDPMMILDNNFMVQLMPLSSGNVGQGTIPLPRKLNLIGCTSSDGYLGRLAKERVALGSVICLNAEVWDRPAAHVEDAEVFRDLRDQGLDVEIRS